MSSRGPPDPDQLELFADEGDDGSFDWFMRHTPSLARTQQTRGVQDKSSTTPQPAPPKPPKRRLRRG